VGFLGGCTQKTNGFFGYVPGCLNPGFKTLLSRTTLNVLVLRKEGFLMDYSWFQPAMHTRTQQTVVMQWTRLTQRPLLSLRSDRCVSCVCWILFVAFIAFVTYFLLGDHLSGKPGNGREFETCQGNVRDVVNSQGNVREKILSWNREYLRYTIYLTLNPEVLATVYLNISISFKNSA